MLDPDKIRNKAGGGGGPVPHPALAICPRCGNVNAAAFPPDVATPSWYVVRCPGCGSFAWDTVAHKATPIEEAPR